MQSTELAQAAVSAGPPKLDPTELVAQLRGADLESLGSMLGDAMAHALKLQAQLEPHKIMAAACQKVIFEKLEAAGRTRLNHAFLDITVDTEKEPQIYEDALVELLDPDLRVDGEPLPADALKKAVWYETVPEHRIVKKHLTHLRKLVKDYGDDRIRDIFRRAVIEVEKRKLIVAFKKTEKTIFLGS